MSAITNHVYEGCDQTVLPLIEAQGPESPRYTPSEMEDSFEEIER